MTADGETLRERRQRETKEQIARTGLRMFSEGGYDETSLAEVAARVGISARTLFHYFRTKPEILAYWLDDDFAAALTARLREDRNGAGPAWPLLREALAALVGRHQGPESLTVDRLFASTPSLRAHKQAIYAEWEDAAFAGLTAARPQEPEHRLRTVAMLGIGCLRLALGARYAAEYSVRLDRLLAEQFAAVAAAVEGSGSGTGA
ncbi:TetR/AcrR family transcriptional regulator [Streptomyces sp. NPDC050560]|uniref:TetR/AcrR family transcriptional regulator n=1 Tax=Streptomyces sp. NPDC050560 TaxID=3365630 RepID=UPI00378DFB2C